MDNPQVRTARSIMREKALDLLERTELSEMARVSAAVVSSVAITAALAYPQDVGGLLRDVAAWQNWLLPKAAASAAVCFNFRRIVTACASVADSVPQEKPRKAVCEKRLGTLEGIPHEEFAHHLFTYGRFSVADADVVFGLPRARYSALAKKLEEIGVLVRGEKNSRVLNPDFGRSDLASVLDGCEKAEDLRPLLRKDGECSYTASPSLPEIRAAANTEENGENRDA